MQRAIWKGAVNFGLVSCPVSMVTAEAHDDLSFTQLDKRDRNPIGYRKYNKVTGEEVPAGQIVKGFELYNGSYVIVDDDDFRKANVKATQTIEIHQFTHLSEINPVFFEKPYYLIPEKEGYKAYELLNKILLKTGKVAIATVVIHTRQYLSAIVPQGDVLVLELMRFNHELKNPADLDKPSAAQSRVSAGELRMAQLLVESMTTHWQPELFKDEYRNDLLSIIRDKSQSQRIKPRHVPELARIGRGSGKPLELEALLKASLAHGDPKSLLPKSLSPKSMLTPGEKQKSARKRSPPRSIPAGKRAG